MSTAGKVCTYGGVAAALVVLAACSANQNLGFDRDALSETGSDADGDHDGGGGVDGARDAVVDGLAVARGDGATDATADGTSGEGGADGSGLGDAHDDGASTADAGDGSASNDGNAGDGPILPSCIADAGAQGVCVRALATSVDGPIAMAVSSAGVYWLTASTLDAVPLSGGSPTQLVSTVDMGTDLVLDSSYAYWSDFSGVSKVLLGGGSPSVLASGQDMSSVAVDSSHVYFTTTAGALGKVDLDGTGLTTLLAPTPPSAPYDVAVASTGIYFLMANGSESDVDLCDFDGGNPTTLASNQNYAFDFIVDPTGLSWVDTTPSEIMRRSFASPQVVPMALVSTPEGLASDGTTVYVSEQGGGPSGSILRMPVGSSSTTTLATAQSPVLLAIDATSVYWFNYIYDPINPTWILMSATPR